MWYHSHRLFVHVILFMHDYCWCTLNVRARNTVHAQLLFCARWLFVHVMFFMHVRCYGTYILCTLYCLLTTCLSRSDYCLIFAYSMLCLYSLFVLIHTSLHVYIGCYLTVVPWLIISHKSYPDLGLNPSRVLVKFSRATLGFPSRYTSLILGGLRIPWVSCNIRKYNNSTIKQSALKH